MRTKTMTTADFTQAVFAAIGAGETSASGCLYRVTDADDVRVFLERRDGYRRADLTDVRDAISRLDRSGAIVLSWGKSGNWTGARVSLPAVPS
jgi:hypothetical protein